MTLLIAITVGVVMAVSVYLLLSRELKAVAMGIFLLSHAANLAIIAVSRDPLGGRPPVVGTGGALSGRMVDPLPQALILTAIVIGFALQAFLLALVVVTWRRNRTLELAELASPPATIDFLRTSPDARKSILKHPAVRPAEIGPAVEPSRSGDTESEIESAVTPPESDQRT